MRFAQDDDMVDTLASDRSDQSFGEAVLPRRALSFPKISSAGVSRLKENQATSYAMLAILHLLAMFVADLFKPRRQLEVENLFLRHQLNIALRRAPCRLRLRGSDRALMVWISWLWPSC